ncbi:hypothetical protein BDD12DRAFT_639361, partial [Trichophaea hybrida]
AIEKNPDIFRRGLRDQWQHLIFQPLSNLAVPRQPQAFILVIDALDECDSKDDIQLMLRLLAEGKTLKTVRLQVFITYNP